ncbi:TolC family protein [Thermithiobacillus plumbiphilus]|uniref:Protein CyaE n=1 Tax=Thermithiobacillus plumbiphilus TaxID=1729899 RepID=A0ABU9D6Q1_9PROT
MLLTVASGFSPAAQALDLHLPDGLEDPWHTDALTAPSPGKPWQPDQPLPTVPASPAPAALPAQPLTLAQLTDLALQNNPATRAAWLQARSAAAGVGLARAAYLPQINGQFNYTQSKAASTAGNPVPLLTRYGPAVSLSYLLWDFGARAGRREAAQYTLLASNLAYNRNIQDLILQVEQNYYLLLGFQALETANRQLLEEAEQNLEAAQLRRRSGVATVGDVYQAESARAQSRINLQAVQNQLLDARGQLARAVGLPVNTALAIASWPDQDPPGLAASELERLLDQARARRPDLVAAEARVRAAQAETRIARAQGRPTISLNANAARSTIEERGSFPTYSYGLSLQIPIFTGFNTRYAVRQSQANAAQAAAQRDDLVQQAALEIWQSYNQQQTARDTIAASQELLRSARLAAEVARARYRAGVGSILEVLSTQGAQANAEAQFIQNRLNWYTALAALAHAAGTIQAPETPHP